ncbi:MAG: hypothetical protein SFV15_10810 [Polyangiaceae bacterium]|nr:hypothetical protein [Polyangiaceae bacterium]
MSTSLRHLHRFMTSRSKVRLEDGRVGSIVRVDTSFPSNETTVTLWTGTPAGPGVAKVSLRQVVGEEPTPGVKKVV